MAAGLGFKDFTTGEVLTAADVDGYLMQGIWVFANAAARDAAVTSPQEGNCCYLKDTDAVQTYSGTAWVGFDDSNAIQNSIVDAKGDIVAASGNDTPARLAVGNNGETLVADSSTSTGLRYTENYAAGKNKIINGDFFVNQRNFTSSTTFGVYGFDRWRMDNVGGTCTYTAQTFTPGTAPVAGYESRNYARIVTASQSAAGDYCTLIQPIEDVRTFAGQTITVSFWAKANTGTPKIALEMLQEFGAGGSPSAGVSIPAGTITLSTAWARYTITVAIPSLSGKTIGTIANSSSLYLILWQSAGATNATRASSIGIQNNTFEFWGVQAEDGSVATAFNTATGTIQGELAACQRYYWRDTAGNVYSGFGTGTMYSTSNVFAIFPFPVTMRVAPSLSYSTLEIIAGSATAAITGVNSNRSTTKTGSQEMFAGSGFATTGHSGVVRASNSTSAYMEWSAEL